MSCTDRYLQLAAAAAAAAEAAAAAASLTFKLVAMLTSGATGCKQVAQG